MYPATIKYYIKELKLLTLYGSGVFFPTAFADSTILFLFEDSAKVCPIVLLNLFLFAVAFDEDFEAELSENHEAEIEVSILAQSPDQEFTEVFLFCAESGHCLQCNTYWINSSLLWISGKLRFFCMSVQLFVIILKEKNLRYDGECMKLKLSSC